MEASNEAPGMSPATIKEVLRAQGFNISEADCQSMVRMMGPILADLGKLDAVEQLAPEPTPIFRVDPVEG